MRTEAFKTAYARLNAAQREAVDTVEGPVMVVAGPGTGKTQILTLRIANILLKTHAEPENILALTFTEAAAAEMRRRLARIIGTRGYSVRIATFHGFCNEVIQTYPDSFEDIIGRTPSDEAIQVRLLEEAIDAKGTDGKLRPFREPTHYLPAIKASISALKREGKTPSDLRSLVEKETEAIQSAADLVHEKGAYKGQMKAPYKKRLEQLEKNIELAGVYEAYQDLLATARVYDYDDMIMSVSRTLAKSDLLLRLLQEQYHYFLVDEHQDTNSAQNTILELLANFHENPNVFVVGDEKQAIFRFQGASIKNFLYFKERYPSAKLITLTDNYRSSQSILDAAGSMIEKNTERITNVLSDISDTLRAQATHPIHPIEIYAFDRESDERYFVAERAGALIEGGVDRREIAIIYRDNKDAHGVVSALDRKGIPFKVESKKNILDEPDIRNLLALMRYIDALDSDERLFSVLHINFLGFQPIDIYRINRLAHERRTPLIEILTKEHLLREAGIEAYRHARRIALLFSAWRTVAHNAPVTEFFEQLVRESGYLATALASEDSAERIARVNTLFTEIKQQVERDPHLTLSDCLRHFTILEERGIPLTASMGTFIPDAVRCMTAHGAKGLEFEYVFIIHAYDGHWGNKNIRELIALPNLVEGEGKARRELMKNDDERRLFYVALTRAKKQVFISYSEAGDDGKERIPSQFIEEIDPSLLEMKDTLSYAQKGKEQLTFPYAPRIAKKVSALGKDYIAHLFEEHGLSATSLNNFLACPWKYVYMNLYRMPKAPTIPQVYGIAVHAAMRAHFDALREGAASKDLFLETFEEHAKGTILERSENVAVIEKGKKTLAGYYDQYNGQWASDTKNELSLHGIVLPGREGAPDIHLTGKLDKLEFSPDGSINVVDYKTGRPKTRNELEGKTKNATGDYLRQLAFYKILLDASGPYRGRMKSGEIDFIEPKKGGGYQKERFMIDTKTTEALMVQIYDVARQIANVSFWDDRCDDKNCEFCRLRDGML